MENDLKQLDFVWAENAGRHIEVHQRGTRVVLRMFHSDPETRREVLACEMEFTMANRKRIIAALQSIPDDDWV